MKALFSKQNDVCVRSFLCSNIIHSWGLSKHFINILHALVVRMIIWFLALFYCLRDAIFVTFANLLTSIFAGFVIFSILGFLARVMHMPIDDVVQEAEGLAFIAYPEAVVQMRYPNLWAILFFFMLFILGLGSQVSTRAILTHTFSRRTSLRIPSTLRQR